MTSQTDALGNVTACGFDAFGNQVSQSLPDPNTGAQDGGQLTTTYGYDLDGNEISATDPMHNVTTIGYDAFGNQISQSLPNPTTGLAGGPTTSYTFDAMGDVLSLTDPDGNTTSWTYDGLGDETSQSEVVSLGYYPGTQTLEPTITATSTYQYDLDGNLTESVDANANAPAGYGFTGEVNTYSYNATNQETGESWYGNTTDAAAGGDNVGSIAHSYDAEGRMLTAANAAGGSSIASYTYGYDGVGNLTSDNVQLGDLPGSDNVLLTSEYDFNGDRTSLSANIGGTLNTDGTVSGGISDFTNTYGYDNLGNMTSIVQTGGDGTTPKCVTLSYDADNRLTGIDRHASDGNSNLVASSAYTYDHDSELTDLSYAKGTTTLAAYHWEYNNDGLVTDAYSLSDTAGSADPSNYLTWSDTHSNYDDDGQLVSTRYTAFYDHPTTNTGQSYDPNGNNTNRRT